MRSNLIWLCIVCICIFVRNCCVQNFKTFALGGNLLFIMLCVQNIYVLRARDLLSGYITLSDVTVKCLTVYLLVDCRGRSKETKPNK